MTDRELMDAPEIPVIARHLKAIAKAMVSLRAKASEVNIELFVEAESGVHLMATDRDDATCCQGGNMTDRQIPFDEGGPRLASFTGTALDWGCGAW
jgi:hypothetical protein